MHENDCLGVSHQSRRIVFRPVLQGQAAELLELEFRLIFLTKHVKLLNTVQICLTTTVVRSVSWTEHHRLGSEGDLCRTIEFFTVKRASGDERGPADFLNKLERGNIEFGEPSIVPDDGEMTLY